MFKESNLASIDVPMYYFLLIVFYRLKNVGTHINEFTFLESVPNVFQTKNFI